MGSPIPLERVDRIDPTGAAGSIDVEEIPEEKFYSSVLEQAHEDSAAEAAGPSADGSVSLESALEAIGAEERAEAAVPELPLPAAPAAASGLSGNPDYDVMSKADLIALAEKRGLRAKKSSSRGEIIGLLRRSEPAQISSQTTGAENGSGPTGSLFPSGASLDGDYPVDLGQSGASLDEAEIVSGSSA